MSEARSTLSVQPVSNDVALTLKCLNHLFSLENKHLQTDMLVSNKNKYLQEILVAYEFVYIYCLFWFLLYSLVRLAFPKESKGVQYPKAIKIQWEFDTYRL